MQITKQQIKFLKSLQQKKYRDEKQHYLVEGVKMVNEAIVNVPDKIVMVCFSPGSAEKIFLNQLPPGAIRVAAGSNDMDRISTQKNSQEAIALMKMTKTNENANREISDLVFALDRVRDPGNMGTIIRLADWFGMDEIICSDDCVDCYNPKVVQSTMGAIFRVKIRYVKLPEVLLQLQEAGATVYGTLLQGENIYSCSLKKPAVLLLGNEANGIEPGLISYVDQAILIPNYNKKKSSTESLNVAIAAAVTVAEFRRQLGNGYSK